MRYFLAYLTANDGRDFGIDYLHISHMLCHNPGVPLVEMVLVVSEVKPRCTTDVWQINSLIEMIKSSSWLEFKGVIWKGNLGRDFSSACESLALMSRDIAANDYVLVINRSAYGPLRESWYRLFVEQHGCHDKTGLVGATINLSGPEWIPAQGDYRHVQTYAYLGQWSCFEKLISHFPGVRCKDYRGAIRDGELELTRRIFDLGLGVSCLAWPDHFFCRGSADDSSLPVRDIKQEIEGLPFKYKYPNYRRNRKPFWRRLYWVGLTSILYFFKIKRCLYR